MEQNAIEEAAEVERPFVLVGQQYLADPGRSVGDVHPLAREQLNAVREVRPCDDFLDAIEDARALRIEECLLLITEQLARANREEMMDLVLDAMRRSSQEARTVSLRAE